MNSKETAIEVRNIAAVCTPRSAERHRLQELADRLEAAPEPLAVVETVADACTTCGKHHIRCFAELGNPAEDVHVTVTVTERT